MKNIIVFLIAMLSLMSCKDANEQQVSSNNNPVQNKAISKTPVPDKKATNGTFLCQINGKDWNYTKASGIVSTHAKTGEHTAIVTFKKKLEKGSESLQLYYDANSFELTGVLLILKFEKKGGGLLTSYYTLKPEIRKRKPQSKLSGTIDLSNPSKASGVAEIKRLKIDYEKGKLLNPEDAVINITGLKFKDIGYSDLDKFAKAYKKQ